MAVAIRELPVDDWAVAIPLFGPNGVVASLEVSGTGALPPLRTLAPVLRYAALALGRRLAEHPQLLPKGTGPTPLRWYIDPTAYPPTLGNNDGHPVSTTMPNNGETPHHHPASRRRRSGRPGHISCVHERGLDRHLDNTQAHEEEPAWET
jgi:hypothetical protein